MHWYGREPRVVLKDTLAWDPAIDVILNRIPARFISPNPAAGERPRGADRARWPRDLDENDAFVIFPEGGNFTPERRAARASTGCAGSGLEPDGAAGRADDERAGAAPGRAARGARRGARTPTSCWSRTPGSTTCVTVGDVWRELPMDKQIIMRWWRVPRAEIPEGRDGAHRLAVRLVGADRRLGRGEPARGPARRRAETDVGSAPSGSVSSSLGRLLGLVRRAGPRRRRPPRPGWSGVVAACGASAASEAASSGAAPPASSLPVGAACCRPGRCRRGRRRRRRHVGRLPVVARRVAAQLLVRPRRRRRPGRRCRQQLLQPAARPLPAAASLGASAVGLGRLGGLLAAAARRPGRLSVGERGLRRAGQRPCASAISGAAALPGRRRAAGTGGRPWPRSPRTRRVGVIGYSASSRSPGSIEGLLLRIACASSDRASDSIMRPARPGRPWSDCAWEDRPCTTAPSDVTHRRERHSWLT